LYIIQWIINTGSHSAINVLRYFSF